MQQYKIIPMDNFCVLGIVIVIFMNFQALSTLYQVGFVTLC